MNKLQQLFNIKVLIFTLVFTLILPYLAVLLPVADSSTAYAAELTNKDAYKGVALFLLLTLITKYADGKESAEIGQVDTGEVANSELRMLAKVIYAEARGEPYEGQVAVGAVVLNRVEHSGFPNTIRGVVYQKEQFTSVKNGQINLKPNKTAYKAAREALNGRDPSKGAIYFYNPKKAKTLWWLSTRETTVKIANHTFAK
ncbi:MAG: cell wall hydrolase SleB [Candidatus Frackibacter sp. T328-2]|nr:MAG: cell wall hydrolase SleB [Candidatus Frackibacter sp. T328-2]